MFGGAGTTRWWAGMWGDAILAEGYAGAYFQDRASNLDSDLIVGGNAIESLS